MRSNPDFYILTLTGQHRNSRYKEGVSAEVPPVSRVHHSFNVSQVLLTSARVLAIKLPVINDCEFAEETL
jgi:hypothetical protein